VLELRHVETTTASQLKARLKVTPKEDFSKNYNIIEDLAYQVSDREPRQ
jgi:hypothetical protein